MPPSLPPPPWPILCLLCEQCCSRRCGCLWLVLCLPDHGPPNTALQGAVFLPASQPASWLLPRPQCLWTERMYSPLQSSLMCSAVSLSVLMSCCGPGSTACRFRDSVLRQMRGLLLLVTLLWVFESSCFSICVLPCSPHSCSTCILQGSSLEYALVRTRVWRTHKT